MNPVSGRPAVRHVGWVTASAATLAVAAACSSSSGGATAAPTTSTAPTTTAGPSEAGKAPTQVLADTTVALKAAKAVHVSGSIAGTGSTATTLNIRYQGTDASGSISEQGQTVQLIRVGDAIYVKGPAALYGSPAVAAKIGDRWLKLSATSALAKNYFEITDLDRLADDIKPTGTLATTIGHAAVGGQQALVLTDTSDGSTIDVRATGSPVPLQLHNTATDAGTVTFSEYDKSTTITAPTNVLTVPDTTPAPTATT